MNDADSSEVERDKAASLLSIASIAPTGVVCATIWFVLSHLSAGSQRYIFGNYITSRGWPPNYFFIRQLESANVPTEQIILFLNCTTSFSFIYFVWLILRLVYEIYRNPGAMAPRTAVLFLILLPITVLVALMPFEKDYSAYQLSYAASIHSNIWHTLVVIAAVYLSIGEVLAKLVTFTRFKLFFAGSNRADT
ncbi:hypothetical protein CPY51_05640 [Rhizobium tubonense]|uniref:Uncharacterized protein n=1 Tax=Rhizobium tubonense TaxID=484088 RepID=A0A2W4F1T0_9HYPH|nr:hypothetical protein CPY51_05640 [Rhizobium tubonense]